MINLMHSKKRLNLLDKEKVQFDVIKSEILVENPVCLLAVTGISTFDGLFKAADGLEAVNVVGKNGYLLIDIIAYKRDIPPFNLEIINGQLSSAQLVVICCCLWFVMVLLFCR